MLKAIEDGVVAVIGYGGDVVSALLSETGEFAALLPIIGMAIGMGVVGWGIRTIKSLTWGF